MKVNVDSIMAFLWGAIAVIGMLLFSARSRFFEAYEKDRRAHEQARDELFGALQNAKTKKVDIGLALHRYLLAKLLLEGVMTWARWGKYVRTLSRLKWIFVTVGGSLVLIASAYCAIGPVASVGGQEWMRRIYWILSLSLAALAICYIVFLCLCTDTFNKRQTDSILKPTSEMLRADSTVPDYGLVLLSYVVSRATFEE